MEILDFLQYPFAIKAIIAGICISISSALIGMILVEKKYSMIGHGLGELGFTSLILALLINVNPLLVSIPMLVIFSIVIMQISQKKNINGDTVIAIISSFALALGIIITTVNKGFNVDIYGYMFGSLLTMSNFDVILSVVVSILLISVFIIFYNRLCLISYDENYAKASGINVNLYQFIISIFTALVVVIGMRMMGTLMISSLIVFPAIISKKFTTSFKGLAICSAIVSVIVFMLGTIISVALSFPIGATIVATYSILLILAIILKMIIK